MKSSTTILFIILFIPSIFAPPKKHPIDKNADDSNPSKRKSRKNSRTEPDPLIPPSSQGEMTGFNSGFQGYNELAEIFGTNKWQQSSNPMYSPEFVQGETGGSNSQNVHENIHGNETNFVNYPVQDQYHPQHYGQNVEHFSRSFQHLFPQPEMTDNRRQLPAHSPFDFTNVDPYNTKLQAETSNKKKPKLGMKKQINEKIKELGYYQ